MKRSHLIALGVVVFVLTLLAHAPAAALYAWFAPKASDVTLYGVEGTLMQGSLAGISVQGKPTWQDLHWTLHPLALLTGRVLADVESTTPTTLNSRVSLAPWGRHFSNLRSTGSLHTLTGAVGQNYLPVEGTVNADISSLTLKGNIPRSAEGTISVEHLAWTLAKDPLMLGDYKATATTDHGQITVKIESVSGPLQVTGDAKVADDQTYDLDLRVKTKPDAVPMLQTLVQSLGQPDAQGFYHLLRKGKLS